MKFKPTPPRAKIYRFQKYLKIFVSFLLFLAGGWNLFSGMRLLLKNREYHLIDGLMPLFLSAILFGLSIFLYQNRSNNTPRYDGFEP